MIKFFVEPGYDVKKPERDTGNVGIDFFIPNRTEQFMEALKEKNDEEYVTVITLEDGSEALHVEPHGRVNIPSGIRSRIPANVALEAQNKSGVATKMGIVYGAATVDPNYQGIIHISLINTSMKPAILPLGMKVVQFIPRIVDMSEVSVVEDMTLEEFYADFEYNNRGEGAFGSTGV